MGCTPSQPTTPEPASLPIGSNKNDNATTTEGGVTANGRQALTRSDSARSNASSKKRRQGKNQQQSSNNYASFSPANSKTNALNNFSKDNSLSGIKNNINNGSTQKNHSKQNGVIAVVSPLSSSSGKANDPHWIELWKTHQSLLLDPADVHSTIEDFMARSTNQLSATEITFLQRKVRAIVRSSNSRQQANDGYSNKARMVGRILSNQSSNTLEQETRAIAERYHLLSNHVIKKVLPKLPISSSSTTINPVDATYLLLLYSHASLWDRVAEIAVASAKAADLEMDVNKYKPISTVPEPCSPTMEETPEVPPGVSFHALTFIMGLALRKCYWEKAKACLLAVFVLES
jgi:hypothetical protein